MKKRINTYTFDALNKKIVLTGVTVQLDALLLITNLTDNIIIFNFADETKKATVSGSEITLQHDTTSMSNTDELQIFYDDAESYPVTNTELRNTPLPISGTVSTNGLTNTELRASAVAVSVSGVATATKQDDIITAINNKVFTSDGLTNTELRATPVPISGTVSTSGLTDTQLRASDLKVSLDGEAINVTGPVTNTELRATPLPISGTVTTQGLTNTELRASDVKVTLDGETVAVTGTFYPATQPISGALTDTELRANPVTITGSVTTQGLTNTELRATDVKVSLDSEVVNTSDANLLGQIQTLNTSDLSFVLRYIVSIMSDPIYLNKSLNGLNSVLLSGSTTAVTGTLTGVTTVSTVSNIGAVGGKNADMITNDLSNIAWNNIRNLLT